MKSRNLKSQHSRDLNQFKAIEQLFETDSLPVIEKIEAFPKYVSKQCLAKFITKIDLFRMIENINGSIIECGCLHGSGTLTWAKLSSIFEPVNHTRKVISFDTFSGFPSIHPKDKKGTFQELHKDGLKGSSYKMVREAVDVYDINRPLSHIEKVELVKGDFLKTAEKYIEDNPHLVVSMLYLDFDLYEPTKKALEIFVPRIPKGGIIVFDELNAKIFPGETEAVHETLGINNIKIRRFNYDSYVSYAVME